MKNVKNAFRTAALLCCLFCAAFSTHAQVVNIPDANFKAALVSSLCVDTNNDGGGDADVDTNNDGQIQLSEALAVTSLSVRSVWQHQIADLTGIRSFTNLQILDCSYNLLTSLNLQGLTSLQSLYCYYNQLTSLNVQGLTSLQALNCSGSPLTNLNVQGLTNLQTLYCGGSPLTNLNVQGLTNLQTLDCNNTGLTNLNVQGLTNLQTLNCYNTALTSLNVQGLTNLQALDCYNTALTSLNVQGLTNLQALDCYNSQLTSLNVLGATSLQYLNCSNNPLTILNVQNATSLRRLRCYDSQLITLNAQGATNLEELYCNNNQLTTLNVQGATSLQFLLCNNNQLTTLNVQGLTVLGQLYCYNNQLTSLNVQGLTNSFRLDCYNNQLTTLNIQGLAGELNCSNNKLTSLNLQGAANLGGLNCSNNQLTSLNLQGAANLGGLNCNNNQLTSLNTQGLTSLGSLYCDNNHLTSLDISSNTGGDSTTLSCRNNPLSCLGFLPASLLALYTDNTNINCLPNHPQLLSQGSGALLPLCQLNNANGCFVAARIYGTASKANNCVATNITLPNLLVTATNTTTNVLYVANTDAAGAYEIAVPLGVYTVSVVPPNSYWGSCPNTTAINIIQDGQQANRDILMNALVPCTDMEIDHAAQTIMRPCSTATMVVSYYNKGTIASQGSYAELKLAPELTLSAASIAYTAQGNNVYRFALGSVSALQRGSFTLNVVVACTTSMNQTLCTHAEIFPHAYCNTSSMVSWDGSDVTVTGRCIGTNQVRFVLKNTGASPMAVAQSYWVVEDDLMLRGGMFQLAASGSDSVTITADPTKVYRIIANESAGNPAHNTQETFLVWGCNGTNNAIHWGFVNQYALNSGSRFEHQLCTPLRTSYDPNAIYAVSEGTQSQHYITRGTELEYTIRFQNTGNDTAFVVRLLDALPQELDKTTLKIGASSHPMTYSLKGNGVLEFLFTKILLPHSAANEPKSHGFVRYKIRTKANLPAGQTIDNQANIYFDVNAPVATNTYRHTIAADVASVFLSLSEVVTNRNYTVKVMPNPMHDSALLEIIANEDIQNSVKTFTLYNMLGQAVTTQTFNDNTLLLQRENMPSGCYIYTINIDNEQISKGKIVVE